MTGFKVVTKLMKNLRVYMVLGDAVSKLETFVWILQFCLYGTVFTSVSKVIRISCFSFLYLAIGLKTRVTCSSNQK